MKLKSISPVIFLIFVPVLSLFGQNLSQPTRMPSGASRASLNQDVALLKEQLGEMRFEVERLLRENESLELRLKKVEALSSVGVSDVVFRQELASLRAEFNRLNKTQQEELLLVEFSVTLDAQWLTFPGQLKFSGDFFTAIGLVNTQLRRHLPR